MSILIQLESFHSLPSQVGQRSAKEEADKVREILSDYDREYLSQNKEEDFESTYYRSPFRSSLFHIRELCRELENAQSLLDHAHRVASSRLMILKGAAGTGKTHLLCDFAKKRTEAGQPTILLMGQRFLTSDPPWKQAREQLDLSGVGLKEFVGALEAAAQAADCRALLIIDALNEGQGRLVWANHLAPFLEALSKSPWIDVLLSVRSDTRVSSSPTSPNRQWKCTTVSLARNMMQLKHFSRITDLSSHQPQFCNPFLEA